MNTPHIPLELSALFSAAFFYDQLFAFVLRLCGYPPFYSRRGMAMSPGMRDHIVKGDFQFPPREWTRVSKEAKELVQRLLVVDPKKRATIDNLMKDPWILSNRKLPEVPLGSTDVLASEKPNWEEMRVFIETIVFFHQSYFLHSSMLDSYTVIFLNYS